MLTDVFRLSRPPTQNFPSFSLAFQLGGLSSPPRSRAPVTDTTFQLDPDKRNEKK